jgi:hypothetical protein
MAAQGTFECPLDECTISVCADVSKKWLEVATDARKVGFNGLRVDVTALKSDVVAEGFGSWVNRYVVKFAEGEVRVSGGGVRVHGGIINRHTEKYGALMDQAVQGPGLPNRLPRHVSDVDHFLNAPITS